MSDLVKPAPPSNDPFRASAYRLSPPTGHITHLAPLLVAGLERQGVDPEQYRRQLNETTRRRLATESLSEGVDAIDADYEVIEPTTPMR